MPLDPKGWSNGVYENKTEPFTPPVDGKYESVFIELAATKKRLAEIDAIMDKAGMREGDHEGAFPIEVRLDIFIEELIAERDRAVKQRDEAWILIADLKNENQKHRSQLAHCPQCRHGYGDYEKHAMPERGE